LKTFKW